jgi:hypothetical protein
MVQLLSAHFPLKESRMRLSGGAGFRPGRKLFQRKVRLAGAILALTLMGASAARAGELIVLYGPPQNCKRKMRGTWVCIYVFGL